MSEIRKKKEREKAKCHQSEKVGERVFTRRRGIPKERARDSESEKRTTANE